MAKMVLSLTKQLSGWKTLKGLADLIDSLDLGSNAPVVSVGARSIFWRTNPIANLTIFEPRPRFMELIPVGINRTKLVPDETFIQDYAAILVWSDLIAEDMDVMTALQSLNGWLARNQTLVVIENSI